MSVTDEIKSRLDIVSYIGQYVQLKQAGRNYKACCPFHSEKTPSFYVDPDRQTWRCFGACAEGGDLFSFAQKMHGWDFKETLHELGKLAGVEIRKQSPQEREWSQRLDRLRGMMQTAADAFHEQLIKPASDAAHAALAYAISKRGLTNATITTFAIGYAPPGWQSTLDALTHLGYDADDLVAVGLAVKKDNGRLYDRFRDRLMIPIRDDRGRVVGFGARALNPDDNPKYLNSPQTPLFDKSKLLFGLDTAKRAIRESGTAVIVEGYLDAIQAQQAGFLNVVAQMGTATTEAQLKLIVPRHASKVVLALDSDAAGQNATRRSLETARQVLEADFAGRLSVDIRVLQIPDAKDPDDLIREHPETWQALVDAALPVADFVIQMETASLDANASLQEREAIARRVLPILTASESNLYQRDNLQKLAMRLRIGEGDLLRWASSQPTPEARPQPRPAPPPSATPDALLPLEPEWVPEDEYDADGNPIALDAYGTPPVAAPPLVMPPRPGPATSSHDTLESHCLRLLFLNPKAVYQVNRHLRELAQGDPNLLAGPLADFGVADFTDSTYRALMQMFRFALEQDEDEVMAFLEARLDPALQADLQRLIQAEAAVVASRMKGRFSADRAHVWKSHERLAPDDRLAADEVLVAALTLRRERLRRDLDELRFAQADAQQVGPGQQDDRNRMVQIATQVQFTLRSLSKLDDLLHQRGNRLV